LLDYRSHIRGNRSSSNLHRICRRRRQRGISCSVADSGERQRAKSPQFHILGPFTCAAIVVVVVVGSSNLGVIHLVPRTDGREERVYQGYQGRSKGSYFFAQLAEQYIVKWGQLEYWLPGWWRKQSHDKIQDTT
jgi:hypothetical protein